MLEAILREIELQQHYLQGAPLSSVYFGGGTPSLLDTSELVQIFEQINRHFTVINSAEITLEANPDDLSVEKLRELKNYTPVNRLSIGVQSFAEADLLWMNRAHNAREARICLENALKTGFDDLTIDLIYGAPPTTHEQWADNLRIAFEYDIPHLSCYCLTVEDGTALGAFVRKGQQPPVDEQKAAAQFEYLLEATGQAGYEQYEISNFARNGRYAQHNSSYWTGEHYLGIGPSAHSFNGVSRQWNIANNALYIKRLGSGDLPFEIEMLTEKQRFNEYIMTALRTMWGIDDSKLQAFPPDFVQAFQTAVAPYLIQQHVEYQSGFYRLTQAGKLLADRIASDLFLVE